MKSHATSINAQRDGKERSPASEQGKQEIRRGRKRVEQK
jgi:hypothetical protein